jgi:predicted GNAT superfamily acetyltransferase
MPATAHERDFARLGVVAREYIRDLYGESASPLHTGIGTDRLVAVWDIDSDRVARRLTREDRIPLPAQIARLPVIDSTETSPAEWSAGPRLNLGEPALRLGIPSRIQEMKDAHPEAALEWRRRTRAAFESYLERGYEVTEFVRDGDSGWYVLERA